MVKVNWDLNQEYPIDTYMPLLGYAISQCETDIITKDEVTTVLANVAEFYLPDGALIALLNRATKRKYNYIKREKGAYIKNGTYILSYLWGLG